MSGRFVSKEKHFPRHNHTSPCVYVTTVIVVMCLSVLSVVPSFWSWSQAIIFNFLVINLQKKKERIPKKECISTWNKLNTKLQKLWFASCDKSKENDLIYHQEMKNTTTTKDNINKHNIDNNKNYQTTTTTTTSTTKKVSKNFCLILFYSSVR